VSEILYVLCLPVIALHSLQHPEKNSIIKNWKDLGMKPENAYQSQALLELKNEYCNAKRCLECGIGSKILRS